MELSTNVHVLNDAINLIDKSKEKISFNDDSTLSGHNISNGDNAISSNQQK
jgi:hypothetical protein